MNVRPLRDADDEPAAAGVPGHESREPAPSPSSNWPLTRWRALRHRPLIVAALVAIIAAVLAAGALAYRSASGPSPTRGESTAKEAGRAPVPADPNVVVLEDQQLERIKTEPVRTVGFQVEQSAVGRIAFNEDVTTPVFSPYTGRVVRLFAKTGDDVRKGMILFEIDTPDLVQAESDLISTYAAVLKARNQVALARRTADRQEDLYRAKAVAQKDWEQAQSDLRNAESDLRSAEGVHAGARDRLRAFGKTDDEITTIEERRVIDRVTRVLAPIGGTIATRKVGPGQYVKPDTPDPLFTIADLSTMWLLANVSEADIGLIQLGQRVEVHVMAYPNETFRARITNIGAAVDPATHRITVRAEVANPGRKLKAEMFASFRILTSTAVTAPAVPVSAVVRDGDAATVWVASGPKQFTRRRVTLGLEQDGLLQVVSGVQPGEIIATEGALLLSNTGRSSSG